ncbi:MAG: hypothetical protein P4M11_13235 [Candidatus Pacebacteria bacterium]|nr:hypothetical protein [Candidatus Paceibacterota bacterium]
MDRCYSPSCAVLLCFLSQKYELAWLIIHKMYEDLFSDGCRSAQMKTIKDSLVRMKSLAQKLELPAFMCKLERFANSGRIDIRLQMLNPETNFYLIKSLQALLMILPQEQAYFSLYNRLKCLSVPSVPLGKKAETTEAEKKNADEDDMKDRLRIFDEAASVLNKLP